MLSNGIIAYPLLQVLLAENMLLEPRSISFIKSSWCIILTRYKLNCKVLPIALDHTAVLNIIDVVKFLNWCLRKGIRFTIEQITAKVYSLIEDLHSTVEELRLVKTLEKSVIRLKREVLAILKWILFCNISICSVVDQASIRFAVVKPDNWAECFVCLLLEITAIWWEVCKLEVLIILKDKTNRVVKIEYHRHIQN